MMRFALVASATVATVMATEQADGVGLGALLHAANFRAPSTLENTELGSSAEVATQTEKPPSVRTPLPFVIPRKAKEAIVQMKQAKEQAQAQADADDDGLLAASSEAKEAMVEPKQAQADIPSIFEALLQGFRDLPTTSTATTQTELPPPPMQQQPEPEPWSHSWAFDGPGTMSGSLNQDDAWEDTTWEQNPEDALAKTEQTWSEALAETQAVCAADFAARCGGDNVVTGVGSKDVAWGPPPTATISMSPSPRIFEMRPLGGFRLSFSTVSSAFEADDDFFPPNKQPPRSPVMPMDIGVPEMELEQMWGDRRLGAHGGRGHHRRGRHLLGMGDEHHHQHDHHHGGMDGHHHDDHHGEGNGKGHGGCGGPLGFGSREADMCLRESRELLSPSCQAAMDRTEALFRTLNAQQMEDQVEEDFPPPHHVLPFFIFVIAVVCMCGRCARRNRRRKMKHVLKTLHEHPELLEAVEDAAGSPVPLPGWKNKMIAAINANPELKAAVEDAAQMQMPPSRNSSAPAQGSHKPSRSAHFCAMLMVIFSAMMLISMIASLGCGGSGVEGQEGMGEGQQQDQVINGQDEEPEEPLDPMAGFFFSIFFGFMLILTCALLCKCLRCWYRCVCSGKNAYPGAAQAPLKERLIKRSPCGTEVSVVYVGLPASAPDVPELSKL